MSDSSTGSAPEQRLTPWVGRLMVLQAAILVLLLTVVTAPSVFQSLEFGPDVALRRPWTFASYLFAHAGVLPLALNLLLLNAVGPSLERRMGGREFVLFFLYCGIGAAAFALGLTSFMDVPPMSGAGGAVLGATLAFALTWPDSEVSLAPLPIRLNSKTLVFGAGTLILVLAVAGQTRVAHLGFLGGPLAAYLFLRIQAMSRRAVRRPPAAPPPRRAVLAPISVGQSRPVEMRPAATHPEPREESSPEELNRLLDKISASGLESLTAEERRFLDEAAERKRREVQ